LENHPSRNWKWNYRDIVHEQKLMYISHYLIFGNHGRTLDRITIIIFDSNESGMYHKCGINYASSCIASAVTFLVA